MLSVVQAIVRSELAAVRGVELGVVSAVFTNSGGGGDHNLECNVRLRGSDLELQRVPVCVARPGLSAIPREGDMVAMGFAGGDLNAPVILGTLYDEQSHPPDAEPDEVVYVVPDGGGTRRIELQLPTGDLITVTDDAVTIDYGGSLVDVNSGGDITIEAAGNLTLKAGQAVTIEAGTDVSATGLNVTAEGSGQATLKGGLVSIAGVTQFSSS
jgi:phage baseplate assembly protein gpV